MPTSRQSFLDRVRQAVADGNRAGGAVDIPTRHGAGYQGAGADLTARFCDECRAAGGQAHVVESKDAAVAKVLEIVAAKSAQRVLLGGEPFLKSLDLAHRLQAAGCAVTCVEELEPSHSRESFFAADLGISGVDYLIAETG